MAGSESSPHPAITRDFQPSRGSITCRTARRILRTRLSASRIVRHSNNRARAQRAACGCCSRRQRALHALKEQRDFVPPDVPATSRLDDDDLEIMRQALLSSGDNTRPVYTITGGDACSCDVDTTLPASRNLSHPARARSITMQSKVVRFICSSACAIVPASTISTVSLFSNAWMLWRSAGSSSTPARAACLAPNALRTCGWPRKVCRRALV